MALLQPVLYTILQLVVLAGIGFVLKRYAKWPDEFFQRLSRFLVTYALPLYLFSGIAQTNIHDLQTAGLFVEPEDGRARMLIVNAAGGDHPAVGQA